MEAQAAQYSPGLMDANRVCLRPLATPVRARRPPDGDRVPVVQPPVHHHRHGVHGQHGQTVGRGDGAGAFNAHGAQVGGAPLGLAQHGTL